MGLGKTLSMISLVLSKINEKKDSDDSDEESSDDEWITKNKKHKSKYKYFKIYLWLYFRQKISKYLLFLGYYGGTLVICPASLIKQWESEVKNRCKRGILTVLVFHGNNRKVDDRKLSKFSIVVTTYQTVVREAQHETGFYKVKSCNSIKMILFTAIT